MRIAHWGIAILLVAPVGTASAQQQGQQQSQQQQAQSPAAQQAQDQSKVDPLAAAARRAREAQKNRAQGRKSLG